LNNVNQKPYDFYKLSGFFSTNKLHLNYSVNKINLWVLTYFNDWYIIKPDEKKLI